MYRHSTESKELSLRDCGLFFFIALSVSLVAFGLFYIHAIAYHYFWLTLTGSFAVAAGASAGKCYQTDHKRLAFLFAILTGMLLYFLFH